MKIEIFTNNFLPRLSGVSVAVRFLDEALTRLGHRTLIIAPDYGFGHQVKGMEVFRVKSLYLKLKQVAMPLANIDEPAIREVTEKWKPELIHSHHPFGLGNAALSLADRLQVPLVYTFHTLYDFFTHYFLLDNEAVRKAVREYVTRYANRCDLVITPTDPIREYLQSLGVTTRIETVPTGVDLSRFKTASQDEVDRLRRKYGLDRFERTLLYVGRISREKNVGLNLDALKKLTDRGHDFALLFIGDGTEIKNLQSQALEWGLEDRVIWGGFLDQDTLALAYFLGDVFLFPSLSDTQGIVLYEARAAGLPIVATESMASRAVVKSGLNGRFAADDPEDFADKIEEVVSRRDQFSEPFDSFSFSHEALGRTYDRLYRETVNQGRSVDPGAASAFARLIEELKSLLQ